MKQLLKKLAATTSALALLMALIPTQSAQAAFPGKNGKILFTSNRSGSTELYTMKLDGTSLVKLTDTPAFVNTEPAWSSDGTKVVFVSNREGNNEIYSMNHDGSNQVRLTNNSFLETQPSWSPDGSKIVFQSNRDGNNELYVMNADGSSQTNITNHPTTNSNPRWSPDGSRILYHEGANLNLIDPGGSNDTLLTVGATAGWHPDGSKIVFNNAIGGDHEIFTINVDGTGLTRITNNPGVDAVADFSPDGQKIVFRSVRDSNNEVYLMDANGNNQVNLSNNPSSDNVPKIQPLTIPPTTINPNIILNATTGPVIYDPMANHTDVYESIDPTSVTITTQPQKGSVTVNNTTGAITYAPNQQSNSGFNFLAALDNFFFKPASAQGANQDSFSYQICSTANSELCTTATVIVELAASTGTLASTGSNRVAFFAVSTTIIFSATIFWLIHRKFYA